MSFHCIFTWSETTTNVLYFCTEGVEDNCDFVEEEGGLYSPQDVQASCNLSRGIMLFEPKGRHTESYRMKHAFRTCIYNAMHGAYA
jgi:hypothetical protein